MILDYFDTKLPIKDNKSLKLSAEVKENLVSMIENMIIRFVKEQANLVKYINKARLYDSHKKHIISYLQNSNTPLLHKPTDKFQKYVSFKMNDNEAHQVYKLLSWFVAEFIESVYQRVMNKENKVIMKMVHVDALLKEDKEFEKLVTFMQLR